VKKILIITYYWPPSGGAGVQRWLKFTKYLPSYGYQPFVLTVKEENASYAQLDPSLQKEVDPGIQVIRTPSFEPYNLYLKLSGKKEIPFGGFSNEGSTSFLQKVFKFIRGNIFIPDPRKGWNRYALKAAKVLLQKEQIDTIITTGPPHSTHLIGYQLKKRFGVKWIADFRDPWTDIYYYKDLAHTSLAKWYDKHLENKVLLSCDKAITVGYELRDLLVSKDFRSLNTKVQVITNGYDDEDFINRAPKNPDKFVITYSGTVSSYYKMEGFIEALSSIPKEIRNQLWIRFVGNISPFVVHLFSSSGLGDQIEFTGYVAHEKSIAYLFESTLLLLLIPDVPNNKGILTGKFFEYLATGKPILALGPKDGDVARILKETDAGSIFSNKDVEEIKSYILELFNGRRRDQTRGIESYSRRALTGVLSDLIENISK
jgi:glycosyltransferase involved in cell wall biosynthesis